MFHVRQPKAAIDGVAMFLIGCLLLAGAIIVNVAVTAIANIAAAGEASAPLSPFDFDADGDIDLRDFAVFQNTFDLDYFAVFRLGFTGPYVEEG